MVARTLLFLGWGLGLLGLVLPQRVPAEGIAWALAGAFFIGAAATDVATVYGAEAYRKRMNGLVALVGFAFLLWGVTAIV